MSTALQEGNRLLQRGRFNDAIEMYEQSIKVLPELAESIQFNIELIRKRNKKSIKKEINNINKNTINWCIVTPAHTQFIAFLLSEQLKRHGWNVEITNEQPDGFPHDYYIVISPQIYKTLPPGEKRIIYQLEQSVSTRWFTQEYLDILETSLCVLEYSIENIAFLNKKGIVYPLVHYLPIGVNTEYGNHIQTNAKNYDVVFYGDSLSSNRRRKLLDILKLNFNVLEVNDKFGDEMIEILKKAKVVVNIHYYENALLEMPRIQECISLGLKIISEASHDQSDYPELIEGISFFSEGSSNEMVLAVKKALIDYEVDLHKIQRFYSSKWKFMVDRFLLAIGLLSNSQIESMPLSFFGKSNMFGLSLPETILRRNIFKNTKPAECVIFDGLRKSPGWIGCGLSYAALAHYALQNNISNITIMEDDVVLPKDFDRHYDGILEFLYKKNAKWDIFSGLIAVLHPDVEVIDVEVYKGQKFITINKMTSTVFNIYSTNALEILTMWNPEDTDSTSNTIDKFLESQKSIRVVTTLPFFVGHREEVASTLWNFENTRYSDLIINSEYNLFEKVNKFLAIKEF